MPAYPLLCLWLLKMLPAWLRRYGWLGAALPCVYIAAASLAFVQRQRHDNASLATLVLPATPAPTAATRLMVFAPHCDDETLGCAGLIQRTLTAGGSVRTVLFTNGDSFRTAVECQAHSLSVTPDDYVRFATFRQQESKAALGNLGVSAHEVLFLGYPDQGLRSLWNDHWMPDSLYISATTRCASAPYPNIQTPNTAYCGANVLRDVRECLRAYHPNLVTVTHPAEDHGDHAAAAAFVARALQELRADPAESTWARNTRIEYYLIHRGDWPPSVDATPDHLAASPLTPPVEMTRTDTRWTTLPLTAEQQRVKRKSVDLYPSQTAMMAPFLHAFVRPNELYGTLPELHLARLQDSAIPLGEAANLWNRVPPCLLDPLHDNALRDLHGASDIRALYACRDSHHLYLRLDCREPVLPLGVRYTIHLRPFTKAGATSTKAMQILLKATRLPVRNEAGLVFASHGRTLEAAIPWERISGCLKGTEGAEVTHRASGNAETKNWSSQQNETTRQSDRIASLALSAETWAGVEIDKTGVRLLEVDD